MNLKNMRLKDYRSIPFYSLNDRLEADKIREQIGFMHEQGMGGFFLHARGGLETEYMGEEWFAMMRVAVDEAKKLGMDVWFYDENGWPSGFAGGKLLTEENFVSYLDLKEEGTYCAEAIACFVAKENGFCRVTGESGDKIYYNIYVRYNHSYVDLLDPEVTKRFIRCTHEEYYKRFKDEFGKTVAGFFTDEPQYFREALPWSKVIPDEFLKSYGYDVKDGLIYLFKTSNRGMGFRNDFWTLVNRLYVENYQKQIYEWCHAHGCLCTGHTIEETSLYGQMMCCAGAMPYYEYLDIPGIDWLTNFVYNEISPKQLSSVCEQLGKKACITETFGASGHAVTPKDLKAIAQFQYVAGVSLMCQHLFPYSVRGLRKRDFPPYFSEHSAWTDSSSGFNAYFNRLGKIVAENQEDTDILLLHPLRSAYVLYDKYNAATLAEVETSFHETAAWLVKNHLPHHFGDERLMEKYGRVENGKLIIGFKSYSVVIISRCVNMAQNTFSLLDKFVSQGGKLIMVNSPELIEGRKAERALKANAREEQLVGLTKTRVSSDGNEFLRSRRSKDWLYIISTCRDREIHARIELVGVKSVIEYDAQNDRYDVVCYEKNQNGVVLNVTFEKSGALLFRLDGGERAENKFVPQREEIVTQNFLWNFPKWNYFPLDFARLSKDGVVYGERMPVCKIMDQLLYERFDGDIWLAYEFYAQGVVGEIELGAEECAGAEYFLNGSKLDLSHGTRAKGSELLFYAVGALREGENSLIVKVPFVQSDYIYHVLFDEGITETLKNNLTLVTELETIYLAGGFCVNSEETEDKGNFLRLSGKMKLTSVQKGGMYEVALNGYPFLHEKICATGKIICRENERVFLKIEHCFDAVTVVVNGVSAGSLTFGDTLEISPFVREGENEIALQCSPSSQNFYGPLHFIQFDSASITPYCFGYQNNYCGDDPNWTDDYYVKKQGVEKIVLLKGEK